MLRAAKGRGECQLIYLTHTKRGQWVSWRPCSPLRGVSSPWPSAVDSQEPLNAPRGVTHSPWGTSEGQRSALQGLLSSTPRISNARAPALGLPRQTLRNGPEKQPFAGTPKLCPACWRIRNFHKAWCARSLSHCVHVDACGFRVCNVCLFTIRSRLAEPLNAPRGVTHSPWGTSGG